MATNAGNLTQLHRSRVAKPAKGMDRTLFVAATGNRSCIRHDTTASDIKRAADFGVPFLNLDAVDIYQCPEQLIDPKLIRKYQILPVFQRANRLLLAVSNPADNTCLSDIKFHTGLVIDVVLASEDQLQSAVATVAARQESSRPLLQDWAGTRLELVQFEPIVTLDAEESGLDEAPIVRFVNKLLLDAISSDASDIHIEPYENSYRVRFRIDGTLREITRPPIRLAGRVAARIKVMAQLDISEKRTPQDGRIRIRSAQRSAIDFRVSVLPTMWGEKIVLRLLDPNTARLGIDALGFAHDQKLLYLKELQRAQGLILVTGPTGSGKSVTLYTGLNILNSTERNIAAAEDPVELNIEGINQVCVNTKSGLGFAQALRAFLRQDPDVIMVGEIRDLETANTALKAAQTGHLVLSTLHTNSAIDTVHRLLDMGVAPFNLATSLSLIIAQRLARRLCPDCKESVGVSEKLLKQAGFRPGQVTSNKLFRAGTCHKCHDGHKGRMGIFEVVPITASLSRAIMAGASPAEMGQLVQKAGFATLRESALALVAKGELSLDEANRFA